MVKHYKLVVGLLVVLILACVASGWVYNIVDNRNYVSDEELSQLNNSFLQSYGTGITIKKLVSPDRVYAALFEDESGNQFVSWNVGGLWVIVWSSLEGE